MTLKILQAGPVLSVQDAGRRGFSAFGVSYSGPMDPPALSMANAMVSNRPDAAGLEFAGFGGSFRATRRVRVAITGGDADISIGGRSVSPLSAHWLEPDETLTIGGVRGGVWGYLAVSGGVNTPPVMGSCSTHLRFALGGFEGRALRADDILPLGVETDAPCLRIDRQPAPLTGAIRVVPGPQDDHFDEESRLTFYDTDYRISPRCDRMATALVGPNLNAPGGHDIVSDGIVPGSIQVPGSQQPLILMAESQTTGGYPKIATVISADLSRVAQMPPGSKLRFQPVTQAEAEDIWCAHLHSLARRINALMPAAPRILHSDFLLSVNLISGVWPEKECAQ